MMKFRTKYLGIIKGESIADTGIEIPGVGVVDIEFFPAPESWMKLVAGGILAYEFVFTNPNTIAPFQEITREGNEVTAVCKCKFFQEAVYHAGCSRPPRLSHLHDVKDIALRFTLADEVEAAKLERLLNRQSEMAEGRCRRRGSQQQCVPQMNL